MHNIDKHTFFEITRNFSYVPFTQSEGFLAMYAVNHKLDFAFFVDSLEEPSLACMGFVMKRFGFQLLVIDGECLLDCNNIDPKKIREFYRGIAQCGSFDMVEVNSSLPYSALYEIGIREAGYLRPVGLFSSALSNWIDLQQEIRYNENWKRNLKKAEKSNLRFRVLEKPSNQTASFTDFYSRFTAGKGFAHYIAPGQMKALLQSKNFSLALVTDETETVLAGIVFYHRGQHAGLFIAARNLDDKEERGVTFFMYDRLFKYLKSENYATFDMEKLCPSTHSKQSVFLFKNGIKGRKMLYCGEFSYYKRAIYRPLMYVVKRYLLKKVEV